MEEDKSYLEAANYKTTMGAKGFKGLKTVQNQIFEESRRELRFPEAVATYNLMKRDSTIASALNLYSVLIDRVPCKFTTRDGASEEAVKAAEFLNYCKDNLEEGDWTSFLNDVGSYREYGFSVIEKVYTRVKQGKWQGRVKWKGLPLRAQESVSWKWNEEGDLSHIIQNLSILGGNIPRKYQGKVEVEIPINKVLLFNYNSKKGNPEGESLLKGCYIPWKFKTIIEEYEAIGVARDLGGIPVVGIHAEMLRKASENPNGADAAMVDEMKKGAANLHAGEQAFVVMPLAYDQSGKPMFTFELIGINGGGKNYSTGDIIKRKQDEILTFFLADLLKLGQSGGGSFALSDNKSTLLHIAISYHHKLISDVVNKNLIPQTLALNGFNIELEDMPFLEFGSSQEIDIDALSKFIHRTVGVGALVPDKGLEEFLREQIKAPLNDYSEETKLPILEGAISSESRSERERDSTITNPEN